MRKLSIIFIVGALLFFLLAPLYGEEPDLNLKYFPKTTEAFYEKLKDDIKWTTDKRLEQLSIIENMVKKETYDIKVIDRAKELASEVYERITVYELDIARMPLYFDRDLQISAIQAKGNLAEASADMFLIAAELYMKAGSLNEAKKICRMVITTYTGDRYKSYVRKAEFMLEDIKELELKKESSKNKGKNRK